LIDEGITESKHLDSGAEALGGVGKGVFVQMVLSVDEAGTDAPQPSFPLNYLPNTATSRQAQKTAIGIVSGTAINYMTCASCSVLNTLMFAVCALTCM
jgi:hypothetical protein